MTQLELSLEEPNCLDIVTADKLVCAPAGSLIEPCAYGFVGYTEGDFSTGTPPELFDKLMEALDRCDQQLLLTRQEEHDDLFWL